MFRPVAVSAGDLSKAAALAAFLVAGAALAQQEQSITGLAGQQFYSPYGYPHTPEQMERLSHVMVDATDGRTDLYSYSNYVGRSKANQIYQAPMTRKLFDERVYFSTLSPEAQRRYTDTMGAMRQVDAQNRRSGFRYVGPLPAPMTTELVPHKTQRMMVVPYSVTVPQYYPMIIYNNSEREAESPIQQSTTATRIISQEIIYFSEGRSELTSEAHSKLQSVAEQALNYPGSIVQIYGSADSAERSAATFDALKAHGLQEQRITMDYFPSAGESNLTVSLRLPNDGQG